MVAEMIEGNWCQRCGNIKNKIMIENLKNQIEKTRQIIHDGEFEGKWVSDDTIIVLDNQVVILETLKSLIELNHMIK